MLRNTYNGLPNVPIHHSVRDVKEALNEEIADAKRNALEYNVEAKQATLFRERKTTLDASGTANKKYQKAKRVSEETNYTGLA